MDGEQTRISVGVTRQEMDEIQRLARRCNTSVSALGQLALRHLLLQARSGAIPMLPALEPAEKLTNIERRERGMLASIDAVEEESDDRLVGLETRANMSEAAEELDRLGRLSGHGPSSR